MGASVGEADGLSVAAGVGLVVGAAVAASAGSGPNVKTSRQKPSTVLTRLWLAWRFLLLALFLK